MARTSTANVPITVGHTVSEGKLGREDGNNRDNITVPVTLRPNTVRRETDQILSYYQSEHAGRSEPLDNDEPYFPQLSRRETARSDTPSDYSSDYSQEGDNDNDNEVIAAKQPAATLSRGDTVARKGAHTRRPSGPSEGSSDRRRLAIVELDSPAPPSLLPRPGLRKSDWPADSGYSTAASTIQSRRGLHVRDLALVAPPDASPKSYTNLTPPPSAPIITDRGVGSPQAAVHHSRSASAVAHSDGHQHLRRKTSRDIGIVGTTSMHAIPVRAGGGSTSSRKREQMEGLRPPVFQTPTKSRSPSPAVQTPDLSDSATSSFNDTSYQATPVTLLGSHGPLTPAIGEGKDIMQPVVGPVIVNIGSDDAIRRQAPSQLSPNGPPKLLGPRSKPASPYAHYEPGLHATAGPLPPPPRSIFDTPSPSPPASQPPPRPPRLRTPFGASPHPAANNLPDIQALKESLQLPKSVHEKLASRSSSRVDLNLALEDAPRVGGEYDRNSIHTDQDHSRPTSSHRREGAFPPSSGASTTTADSPIPMSAVPTAIPDVHDSVRLVSNEDDTVVVRHPGDGPAVVVSPEGVFDFEHSPKPELRHQSSWVSIREGEDSAPQGRPIISRSNTSDSRSFGSGSPPPPPSKSPKTHDEPRPPSGSSNPFRNTLTNLKRFSALPRTPSQLSMSASSHSRQTRTPSPSHAPLSPLSRSEPPQKTIARWPLALQYADVLTKKSALERSKGYADKINELAQYDCGLSEWVMATKYKGTGWKSSQSVETSFPGSPRAPSSFHFTPQPRHSSRGSMGSEMTFPVRSDAYTATDLSTREIDDLSSTKSPPALPYPVLATPSRSSNRTSILTASSQRYEIPLSASSSKSSATGFFASFGRKASVKKERGLTLSPPSSHKVLTKRLPDAKRSSPPTRPAPLTAPTVIPGGPRTAPKRMQRSQTISVSPIPTPASAPAATSTDVARRSTHRASVNRRPSLFGGTDPGHGSGRSTSVVPVSSVTPPVVSDPYFEEQVDKLSDLLPHADRQVLAGYLRRSGQDILAIGQYLEDEKNGCLQT